MLLGLTHAEWTPRSRFWKHIQESEQGLLIRKEGKQEDQYENIRTCLEKSLPEQSTLAAARPAPEVVDMLNDTDGTTLLVEIEKAISPEQVAAVVALAACAREFLPDFFDHRDFEYAVGGGGNEVTFLNIILQLFLPHVADMLQRTAELAFGEAQWQAAGYPSPGTLGLRTTEYLSYSGFKCLGEHADSGSIYTILFAMAHPKEVSGFLIVHIEGDTGREWLSLYFVSCPQYQGGEFFINDSNGHKYYFKPRQYSAVVFLSESNHGVTEIVSGHREMFTNELWKYDDPPWPEARPLHASMELFLEHCEELNAGGPSWPTWPPTTEVEEWAVETDRGGIDDEIYEARANAETGPFCL